MTRDNRGDDATTQYPVSLSLTLHDVFGVSLRLRLTRNDGLFGDAYHTSQWDEKANTLKQPHLSMGRKRDHESNAGLLLLFLLLFLLLTLLCRESRGGEGY